MSREVLLSVDSIRNFDPLPDGQVYGLTPWFASRDLKVGKHALRVDAVDRNGNVGTVSVAVEKVRPGTLKGTRAARYTRARVRCRGRTCTADFGRLAAVKAGPSIGGKVSVEWQWRNKKRKWRKLLGGTKAANKPLVFTAKLRKKGHWRVRAVYKGSGQYKAVKSKFVNLTAR